MTRTLTTALLLLGALLLATPAFADANDVRGYGMGPGMMGGGYGMGYGMGPGMMGGGMMGMDPLAMHPELAQLPAEKQEQLRKLHLGMMQAMIQKRAELQVKALSLGETMRTFPLNQKAAREQWAAMDQARKDMFELRVGMMAQVQQIVGKELWEQMHTQAPFRRGGYGPGAGGMMGPGGGMGPGMMGPQQPPR